MSEITQDGSRAVGAPAAGATPGADVAGSAGATGATVSGEAAAGMTAAGATPGAADSPAAGEEVRPCGHRDGASARTTHAPSRVRTVALPLLAAFIWGVAFVAQKSNTVGALTFNAARGVVACVFLLLVVLVRERGNVRRVLVGATSEETRSIWLGGLLCGAALALATFLQQYGLNGDTEAGKAGFLTAMYIVLVPVMGLFLGKWVRLRVWLAVALAVLGLYQLCLEPGSVVSMSDMSVLLCSFVFAAHIHIVDHFSPRCDGVKLSCAQFFFATVFSSAGALALEPISLTALADNWWPILYLGVMSSGVAYTLQIIAQRDANPATLSLLLSMESVFSVLAGAVVLGEVMQPREYIGCAIMFAAVILSQLPSKQERRKERREG